MNVYGVVSNGGLTIVRARTPQFGRELFRFDSSPSLGAESSFIVNEGETSDSSVFLMSQPTGNVTLTVRSSDPAIATVDSSLTFTPDDWHIPKSINLQATANADFGHETMDFIVTVDEANSTDDYHGVKEIRRTVRVIDQTAGAYRDGGTVHVVSYSLDDSINVSTSDDRVLVNIGDRTDSFALKRVGRVTIRSGAGDDSIAVSGLPATISSGDGNDTISGSEFADKIESGSGNDLIHGNAGPDTAFGERGNDTILGGSGQDEIYGNEGADVVLGDSGADRVIGGSGNDVLNGNNGPDTVNGGRGHDIAIGGGGNDHVTGGRGRDIVVGGTSTHSIASLQAISEEWTSDRDYEIKVANIVDGSGSDDAANRPAFLTRGVTVLDDDSADSLFGSYARDLFFASTLFDELSDRNPDTEFAY